MVFIIACFFLHRNKNLQVILYILYYARFFVSFLKELNEITECGHGFGNFTSVPIYTTKKLNIYTH